MGVWRNSCAVLVLLALSACARVAPLAPGPPAVRTADLAVVTWNLHKGEGDLERLLDDLAAGRLTDAPVRDYVVLLQEAVDEGEDVRDAAAARTLSVAFSAVRRTEDGVSGNAIISTTPLRDVRTIDLPRERQQRAALAATIDVAGAPLFVVATHLENRLGWRRGLFGDRARGRQAEALLAAVPGGHGIIGGDMNTMLGADESAWRALFARFPDTPPDPEPTFRDRLVLDHLFFDLPDGWTVTRRVVPERYGSDHHPVLGVIRTAANAAE